MSRLSTRTIGTVALVALAILPLALVAVNVIQSAHYDAMTQPGSQLALGEDGWLITAGFFAAGVGTLMLAEVFRRTLPGNRWVAVLLALTAVLNGLVAGVFPTDPNGVAMTTHGAIHNFSGLAGFLIDVAIIFVAGRAFRTNPVWRSFSRPSLVWGGVAVAATVLMFILGGLHLFGLGQRIAVASWLSWFLTAAWRARSLGRSFDTVARLEVETGTG